MPTTVNMTILYLSPSIGQDYIVASRCFTFTQKEAVPFGEMSIKRCCAASMVVNGSLWITGGRGMHFYCFVKDQRNYFNPLRPNGMAFLFFNVGFH